MSNSFSLEYSEDALCSRVDYLISDSHINVIVEDLNKEYIYETLFKRMFDNIPHIKVISAGGKPAVKKIYEDYGCTDSDFPNRRFFYIFDGDFDRFLYPESIISDECCYYFSAYNIESYFIDEFACMLFIKGRMQCLEIHAYENLNFNFWKNEIIRQASKLFFLYCYVQENFPTEENVSISCYQFIDLETGFEKEDNIYNILHRKYSTLDENFNEKVNNIISRYNLIHENDYFFLICGKFLLDSLMCYIKKIIKNCPCKTINKDDFIWHLINNFNINNISELRSKFINYI